MFKTEFDVMVVYMVIENYVDFGVYPDILLQYGENITLGLLGAGILSILKKKPC